ncbi:MAG: hypothetical protein LUC17_01205 [Oscillospiraceae bacterium]|nr:hypothetical protein [Oscillospiraceae bacterium]
MRFTKIPEDTFKNLQLNAGVLLSDFDTTKEESEKEILEAIIGATSGGTNFAATPTYSDYGEDIDNCPTNVKELKKLDGWEVKMSGSFISVDTKMTKRLVGAADVDTSDETKIVPRNDVKTSDFEDIWWVGDYSDENDDDTGGYVAIHMMNSLSTGGFSIQSNNRAKGTFAFEFTGHYTLENQDQVPFEVYIKEGTGTDGADGGDEEP